MASALNLHCLHTQHTYLPPSEKCTTFSIYLIWNHEHIANITYSGDGNEEFIDLQKNDDSYGIPHGTLNKKQTSNQQDSPHLPEFSNKTNLSIRIDVSPYPTHRPNGASPYKRVGVFVKFCFGILIISRRYRGIGESGVFGWGENGKKYIYWINKFVLL